MEDIIIDDFFGEIIKLAESLEETQQETEKG